MRHRRKGRKLGRNPSHQRALLRNLATALFLTESDAYLEERLKPKVRGRIITTLAKAKEVRPLVEKCISIARRVLPDQRRADKLRPSVQRYTEAWRAWRHSPDWLAWTQAIAPVVAARRRVLRLLGNKQAVRVLFDELAERFEERRGGYTRIVRLAKPRLGDSAPRAILEFVGVRDRVRTAAPRPIVVPEAEPPASPSTPAAASPPEAAPAEPPATPAASPPQPQG